MKSSILSSKQTDEADGIIVSVLQMSKLRLLKLNTFPRSHSKGIQITNWTLIHLTANFRVI